MNDLLLSLNDSCKGCFIGNKFVNNICYADDLVILCPSAKGLNSLLAICSYCAISHDIIFNTEKSQCMLFKSKDFKLEHIPDIQLQGSKLAIVNTYLYLGHLITCDLTDDADILRQRHLLCIRANMLARCFSLCSSEVKDHLFKTFCTSIYCNYLWCSFEEIDCDV